MAMGKCLSTYQHIIFIYSTQPHKKSHLIILISTYNNTETALVMSHAMGRTLVLPPEKKFYLLGNVSFALICQIISSS